MFIDILTTVGTSAISNWSSDPRTWQIDHKAITGHHGFNENQIPRHAEIAKEIILACIEDLGLNPECVPEAEILEKLPAEVVTLMLMNQQKYIDKKSARVRLFYTDTLDGYLASLIVKTTLSKLSFANESRKMENIHEGPNGFNPLKESGYFRDLFESYTKPCVVFTGGYKALVPPLTRYCIEKKMQMFYLYEGSSQVLLYKEDGSITSCAAYDSMFRNEEPEV